MTARNYFLIGIVAVVLIFGLIASGNMVEKLDAEQVMVVQDWLDGDLHWYVIPGTKGQYFGRPTKYHIRLTVPYEQKIRFNDGGHAVMNGSMQFNLPTDENNLTYIYKNFPSEKALVGDLIERVLNKAIYMTGPLMSSKESYGDRRSNLIQYVEDQIQNGVYQTRSKDIKVIDPLTGDEKNAKEVEIITNPDGTFARQEAGVLSAYGIEASNFVIDDMPYDEAVEAQIKQQQEITMEIQTAIASAKKAEQRTITTIEEGKANAAATKWEQEAIKAQAVVKAEQEKEVAALLAQAAEFYKKEQILRADADAYFKREVMKADGALEIKTRALIEINKNYATALQNIQHPIVPSVVMGESKSGTSATDLIDMLKVKTARELNLDMSVPTNKP